MNYIALECFLAIAECGSFTKAASQVNRTQSAVTQQICNLEKKFSIKLFNRGKTVTLTKDGELFFQYALRLYRLHQEVLDRFKNPDLDGEITIGIPEDFATLFLADVLVDFSRIHPRVVLNVECDLTLNLLHRFNKGKLNLVIAKMSSPHEFPHGVEIWKEPLVWVGKYDDNSCIKKKEPLPLVVSPEPCVYRSRAIKALEMAHIPWRVVYSSPSYAGRIAAVNANMGITILPLKMIPKSLEQITGQSLPPLSDIHVSLLKQSEPSNMAMNTLSEFLLKKLKGKVL